MVEEADVVGEFHAERRHEALRAVESVRRVGADNLTEIVDAGDLDGAGNGADARGRLDRVEVAFGENEAVGVAVVADIEARDLAPSLMSCANVSAAPGTSTSKKSVPL
jgi:hypothetical protein